MPVTPRKQYRKIKQRSFYTKFCRLRRPMHCKAVQNPKYTKIKVFVVASFRCFSAGYTFGKSVEPDFSSNLKRIRTFFSEFGPYNQKLFRSQELKLLRHRRSISALSVHKKVINNEKSSFCKKHDIEQ